MISTFGCNNGLILAGARAYYAMARDGLFFRAVGTAEPREGAGVGAGAPGALGGVSRCCRAPTIRRRGAYGNLYSNLLDYVISAALIFYILTIAGIFRLRQTRPDADRPYRAFGYPVDPGAVHRRRRGHPVGVVRLPAGDDLAGTDDRAAGRAGVFRVAAAAGLSRWRPQCCGARGRETVPAHAPWRVRRTRRWTSFRATLTSMRCSSRVPAGGQ